MRKKIDCFLACQTPEVLSGTIAQLRQSSAVRHIFLMVSQETDMELPQDCTLLVVDQLQSSQYVMQIAEHAVAPYQMRQWYMLTVGRWKQERVRHIL